MTDHEATLHQLQTDAATSPAGTADASVHTRKIVDELVRETGDLGSWLGVARANEENMLAIWDGQSEDAKKWEKNYNERVFPWDGASDTRVRLIDATVDEIACLNVMSVFSADLRVMAMEAKDVDAAGRVQTLINYELKQRLRAELWRELNFLAQWQQCFGHAIMHVGWKQEWTTGRESLNEQQLAEMLAEQGLMEVQALTGQPADEQQAVIIQENSLAIVLDALESEGRALEIEALIRRRFPTISKKRAKQIVKDIRTEGVAEFRLPVAKPGRPTVRALTPGIDVIYPGWCDAINDSPWVAMVLRLSEPDLRAKVNEGWNQEFIDAMLDAGPSPVLDTSILERSLSAQVNRVPNGRTRETLQRRLERNGECYECFHVFVRVVDEEGIPGTQEIVLRPDIKNPDDDDDLLLGLDRLVDYWHEGGCFVDFRREWKTRSLWQTRGQPELIGPAQWEIKGLRDSRMDRTSLATLPPTRVNPRRLPGNGGKWDVKPGIKIPATDGDNTDFMRVPPMDGSSLEMESSIRRDVADLTGRVHPELPPTKIDLQRQWIVNGFLISTREVVLRILGLDQQFMSPIQVSRVIGSGPMPFQVTREEIAGQYDIVMSFDVRTLDSKFVTERWNAINQAFQTDRSGALNDVALTRWKLASIDPNLADIALMDMQAKSKQEVEEERDALGKLMLGIETVPPEGANARVRLETLQGEIQRNPKAFTLYQQDPLFRESVDKRLAKWEFDLTQQDNARIGATGWEPAMKEPTAADRLAGNLPLSGA